jgi:hypothetical protein
MYKGVKILQRELDRRSANIPLLIPIPLGKPINKSNKQVVADIKLPITIEQRLLDIFLEDVGDLLAIGVPLVGPEDGLDGLRRGVDSDAGAAIGQLARLHDPKPGLPGHLQLGIVSPHKPSKLRIIDSQGHMEGQRHEARQGLPSRLVVLDEGQQQGLFVAQHEILGKMVVDLLEQGL